MSNVQSYIKWINKKLKLNDYSIRNQAQLKNWKVNRGQIYTCFLGENISFEKSKLAARPCIIVSTQRINHESGNIIIVPLSNILAITIIFTSIPVQNIFAAEKDDYLEELQEMAAEVIATGVEETIESVTDVVSDSIMPDSAGD